MRTPNKSAQASLEELPVLRQADSEIRFLSGARCRSTQRIVAGSPDMKKRAGIFPNAIHPNRIYQGGGGVSIERIMKMEKLEIHPNRRVPRRSIKAQDHQ